MFSRLSDYPKIFEKFEPLLVLIYQRSAPQELAMLMDLVHSELKDPNGLIVIGNNNDNKNINNQDEEYDRNQIIVSYRAAVAVKWFLLILNHSRDKCK